MPRGPIPGEAPPHCSSEPLRTAALSSSTVAVALGPHPTPALSAHCTKALSPPLAGALRPHPAPGHKLPKGMVFKECIRVLKLVLKHNTGCKFLVENVDFSDMVNDWNSVCVELGKPTLIDSVDFSNTKRNRAWWTNIKLPEGFPGNPRPLEPDACMEETSFYTKSLNYHSNIGNEGLAAVDAENSDGKLLKTGLTLSFHFLQPYNRIVETVQRQAFYKPF